MKKKKKMKVRRISPLNGTETRKSEVFSQTVYVNEEWAERIRDAYVREYGIGKKPMKPRSFASSPPKPKL